MRRPGGSVRGGRQVFENGEVFRVMFRLRNLRILAVVLVLGGCSDEWAAPGREYEQNRQLWERQEVSSYTLEFKQTCYCPPDIVARVLIEVVQDSIVAISDAQSGESVDETRWIYFLTIEEIFDRVKIAIDSEVDELSVEYDQTMGFPVEVYIDYERLAVDDEWGAVASLRTFVIQ